MHKRIGDIKNEYIKELARQRIDVKRVHHMKYHSRDQITVIDGIGWIHTRESLGFWYNLDNGEEAAAIRKLKYTHLFEDIKGLLTGKTIFNEF